jgi:hypothetical protein
LVLEIKPRAVFSGRRSYDVVAVLGPRHGKTTNYAKKRQSILDQLQGIKPDALESNVRLHDTLLRTMAGHR